MHILFTGPESTGKTTLASWLASETNLPLVEEMSRPYLDMRKGNNERYQYSYHDLHEIVMLQRYEESHFLAKGKNLVCDTDLMTIIIWAKEVYGRFEDQWFEWWKADIPDITFLCKPDIPWMPDPLRENPKDRDRIFNIYKSHLNKYKRVYVVLEGDVHFRQKTILSAIRTHKNA